jgi:hypothetical protein
VHLVLPGLAGGEGGEREGLRDLEVGGARGGGVGGERLDPVDVEGAQIVAEVAVPDEEPGTARW